VTARVLDFGPPGGRLVAVLPVAVLVALVLLVVAVSWGAEAGSTETRPAEPTEPRAGDPAQPHGRAA